ncbi:MAG TPA: DNA repair protein RecN [Actinomycetota bacterium]|nr:DNA repair protein RecN [Actinomycetota bacterium]
MLTHLIIENLGIIDRVELEFGPGCSALTGETGAGKTMLVASLGQLLGDRADKTLIRYGETKAHVEARFEVPSAHGAIDVVSVALGQQQPAIETGEVEIILSRSIAADGKATARLNGRMIPVATLKDVGRALIEIAGQHEHQRLSSRPWQRDALDAFAGEKAVSLRAQVADKVRALGTMRKRLAGFADDEKARARREDVLRFEIAEIEEAALRPGELDGLRAEAARLDGLVAMAAAVARVGDRLSGEGAAVELLGSSVSDLRKAAASVPELEALARRIEALAVEASDIAGEVATMDAAADPGTLDAIQSRIAKIAALTRKYGDDDDAVLDYLDRASAELEDIRSATDDAAALQGAIDETLQDAVATARSLSALRDDAAARLKEEVEGVLGTLAMADARFEVALIASELGEGGLEGVEMRIAANPGEEPRPLHKVASGGELSRVSLALHLVLSDDPRTTIFDEVDAGVGGRAAQSVGAALARLARSEGRQVMVVTHLPQVAAFADAHVKVEKLEAQGRAVASVTVLDRDQRLEELSRMLSGLEGSATAKEHAQELLELAAGAPTLAG